MSQKNIFLEIFQYLSSLEGYNLSSRLECTFRRVHLQVISEILKENSAAEANQT